MRRALLIGIDNYSGQDDLKGCAEDARKMSMLLAEDHDGKPNFHCHELLGKPGDAAVVTKANLRRQVKELLASPANMALLYFSGHGALDTASKEAYLVTQDAVQNDLGYPMSELLRTVQSSPVKEIVIILDTCHSGAAGQDSLLAKDVSALKEGVTIMSACRATEASIATNKGSLFTTLLCDALAGGASDVVGEVNVASAYAFADQVLGPWHQRPLFKANVSSLSPLRMAKPTVPHNVLRKLPEFFPTEEHILDLDPSFEPDKTGVPEEWKDNKSEENENIFWQLQKLRDGRLLIPEGAEHLYYAAINSKACKLTALGKFYRQRVTSGKL